MTIEYKQSLSELNKILHYMDGSYFNKLPEKFIKFVENNMDKDYRPNISENIPISEQELKKDTKVLLSLLYRNYWCDEEEKERLKQEDIIKKIEYEKELREKYNPDNIFKDSKKIEVTIENNDFENREIALVEYSEMKWYRKIFNKILSFFKK